MVDPTRLKDLYSIMQSVEGKIGGGEGVEGLYGSIKCGGLQKILECLVEKCGMGRSSIFVDVGAGIGRIGSAYGIEVDSIKCEKGEAFIRQTLARMQKRQAVATPVVEPEIHCCDIQNVTLLDPATHAYSFWEGVPPAAKEAFGGLFALSTTLQAVAVVQRAIRGTDPASYMAGLGFGPLRLEASFPVSMTGSGRNFRAYIFSKDLAQQAQPAEPAAAAVSRSGDGARSPALLQQQLTTIFPKAKSAVVYCNGGENARNNGQGGGEGGPLSICGKARPTYHADGKLPLTARALRLAARHQQAPVIAAVTSVRHQCSPKSTTIDKFLRSRKSKSVDFKMQTTHGSTMASASPFAVLQATTRENIPKTMNVMVQLLCHMGMDDIKSKGS